MTLLDPGAEPRTLLRYHLTAGQTETLEMVMTVSMTTKCDSQERSDDAPAMRMAASIAITHESMASTGSGTLDVDLGSLAPHYSASVESSTLYGMNMGEETADFGMVMTMDIQMQPAS